MPVSGPSGEDGSVRVRTAVSRDPETGDITPVTTVVPYTNPGTGTNLDLLSGNVYHPNNVGVGQELNGLDRISREESLSSDDSSEPQISGGDRGDTGSTSDPHPPSYSSPAPSPSSSPPPSPHEGAVGEHGLPHDDPDFTGPHPILLDLDGAGLAVTELSQSTIFVDGGDGLGHRTAWAGAGDGVLFFDADGSGDLSERREYVFTDWDPTATSDLEGPVRPESKGKLFSRYLPKSGFWKKGKTLSPVSILRAASAAAAFVVPPGFALGQESDNTPAAFCGLVAELRIEVSLFNDFQTLAGITSPATCNFNNGRAISLIDRSIESGVSSQITPFDDPRTQAMISIPFLMDGCFLDALTYVEISLHILEAQSYQCPDRVNILSALRFVRFEAVRRLASDDDRLGNFEGMFF